MVDQSYGILTYNECTTQGSWNVLNVGIFFRGVHSLDILWILWCLKNLLSLSYTELLVETKSRA